MMADKKELEENCEWMRNTLRDAEALAAKALAYQPENTDDCWWNLSAAVGKLRAIMRPKPHTLAWNTEIDYYLEHDPDLRWFVKATGKYHTPLAAIDAVIAKPPLGLVPRYVRDEQRAREIIAAVLRYIDNGKPVPHEWIEELAERTTVKESEAK